MRVATSFSAIIFITFLVMSGCAGKNADKVSSKEFKNEFKDAPQWVLDGGSSIESGIAAVGSAKIGKAGMNFARNEALANGRDELARQMSTKVKNLMKNFAETTGIGDDETVDKVTSSVSKQISNETLVGSKQRDLWISPGSDLYILVAIDSDSAKEAVKNSIQTSMKNENAMWQKFQARNAHEELEKEIEKEFKNFVKN